MVVNNVHLNWNVNVNVEYQAVVSTATYTSLCITLHFLAAIFLTFLGRFTERGFSLCKDLNDLMITEIALM